MAEFIAVASQTIQPGASAVFYNAGSFYPNYIFHDDGSSIVRIATLVNPWVAWGGCCCQRMPMTVYPVAFHGNIAVPTGQTVGEISLAVVNGGEIEQATIMRSTPSAVEEFNSVGTDILVAVPAICGCGSIAIRNTSTIPILLENAVLVVDPPTVRS